MQESNGEEGLLYWEDIAETVRVYKPVILEYVGITFSIVGTDGVDTGGSATVGPVIICAAKSLDWAET
jgi:hypothetical protein